MPWAEEYFIHSAGGFCFHTKFMCIKEKITKWVFAYVTVRYVLRFQSYKIGHESPKNPHTKIQLVANF